MCRTIFLATLFSTGLCHASTTLIDVSFPAGTGTNPTFLEIDNGVGSNSWTQASGVLSTSTNDNSAVAAASDTTIDFTSLGGDSLVLTATISSVSGTLIANGIFVGFQRRNNGGTGADLWNNLPTSFGLVIPGSSTIGNGTRAVAPGGNAGSGRYQAASYGVATLASIQDGFDVTLTVDSSGWDLAIAGLESAGAVAITGGSGSWGSPINNWGDFTSDMRVGVSYQSTTTAGDLSLSRITLTQIPEPSALALATIALAGFLRRRR